MNNNGYSYFKPCEEGIGKYIFNGYEILHDHYLERKIMKILGIIFIIFFTVVTISMFGFYLDVNSFSALTSEHLLMSCVFGFLGLMFSWLVSGVL